MIYINVIGTILITVVAFGILIFIHEFGHFIVAKACGIRVNEFAIGMGPKILKFGKKETTYTLRAFPIGGYCAMEGEDSESEDERSFYKKPVWQRMCVVLAGAVMNVLLGFIILTGLAASQNGFASKTVATVSPSVAGESSIQVGDELVSINGYRITVGDDITFGVYRADPDGSQTLTDINSTVVVRRNGKKITINNFKCFYEYVNDEGKTVIDYSFKVYSEKKTLLTVLKHGFFDTLSYVRVVWLSLGDLITGKVGIEGVSGVVGVGSEMGKAASMGIYPLMSIVALITVNLGVVNLLPFPALDGWRALTLIIEAIRRKPIKKEIEGYVNLVGMGLLLLLAAIITVKDILNLF